MNKNNRFPYPTTDLDPRDALRVLRARRSSRQTTLATMLLPINWKVITTVWGSRANAAARASYDLEAFGKLFCRLHSTTSSSVATRKPNLTVLERLARHYRRHGVERSALHEKAHVKAARDWGTAQTAAVTLGTSAVWRGFFVDLDVATLLGDLLADKTVEHVVLTHLEREFMLPRRKLLDIRHAVGEREGLVAYLKTDGPELVLSFRWTRGGLNLRSAHVNAAERGKTITVAFDRPLPEAPVEEAVVPPKPAVDPMDVSEAFVRDIAEIVHRHSTPVEAPPAPDPAEKPAPAGLSPTQRARLEYKRLRPIVQAIQAKHEAGQVVGQRVVDLLCEARACKPTSWGSVLGKWRKIVAEVSA